MKMNPEVKAKWVAALRSGEYKQGYTVLNERGNMCCLGVACDLFHKETGQGEWITESERDPVYFDDGEESEEALPPPAVVEWLEFDVEKTTVEIGGVSAAVYQHNDGGTWGYAVDVPRRTFAEIADAIEAQL